MLETKFSENTGNWNPFARSSCPPHSHAAPPPKHPAPFQTSQHTAALKIVGDVAVDVAFLGTVPFLENIIVNGDGDDSVYLLALLLEKPLFICSYYKKGHPPAGYVQSNQGH